MDPLRPSGLPGQRGVKRRAIARLRPRVTLYQPHCLAVGHVDRRQHDERTGADGHGDTLMHASADSARRRRVRRSRTAREGPRSHRRARRLLSANEVVERALHRRDHPTVRPAGDHRRRPSLVTDWGRVARSTGPAGVPSPLSCAAPPPPAPTPPAPSLDAAACPGSRASPGARLTSSQAGTWGGFPGVRPLYYRLPWLGSLVRPSRLRPPGPAVFSTPFPVPARWQEAVADCSKSLTGLQAVANSGTRALVRYNASDASTFNR